MIETQTFPLAKKSRMESTETSPLKCFSNYANITFRSRDIVS